MFVAGDLRQYLVDTRPQTRIAGQGFEEPSNFAVKHAASLTRRAQQTVVNHLVARCSAGRCRHALRFWVLGSMFLVLRSGSGFLIVVDSIRARPRNYEPRTVLSFFPKSLFVTRAPTRSVTR